MLKRIVWVLVFTLPLLSTLTLAGRPYAFDLPTLIPGDVNRDNTVDIVDVVIVSAAFGSKPSDPVWNSDADINFDGLINIVDLAIVAVHFGAHAVFSGWRSSPYGFQQEAEPAYWIDAAKYMASKINNSVPSGVWILGESLGRRCRLNFPSSEVYPNVTFSSTDQSERYLEAFDAAGLKVWLQVEPADAEVEKLIDLVLGRYHQHSCVIGFGIDVEWLQAEEFTDGRQINNQEAQRWLNRVKSYDPDYKLFLKHWLIEKMPTSYANDTVFVCDGQEYNSIYALVQDFKWWGVHFAGSEVYYQIGYASDEEWWSRLSDPFQAISNRLYSEIPNCYGVYWVDFTLPTVYPPD